MSAASRFIPGSTHHTLALQIALQVAADLLTGEGYDTDPDYHQEWQTITEPLATAREALDASE